MKVCLKQFNEKNANGVFYTKKELQKSLDEYLNNNSTLYGVFGKQEEPTLDLSTIAFLISNPFINDAGFYGDIVVLDTHMGRQMKEVMDAVRFGLIGVGLVESDGSVHNYQLIAAQALVD